MTGETTQTGGTVECGIAAERAEAHRIATTPHAYVSSGVPHWRTCKICDRGANARVHRAPAGVTLPGWADSFVGAKCHCGAPLVHVDCAYCPGHTACARSGFDFRRCADGCVCRRKSTLSEVDSARPSEAVEAERRQDQAEPCNAAPPTSQHTGRSES